MTSPSRKAMEKWDFTISSTCPICGKTTHHPEDVRQGYCPQCHAFTRSCCLRPCAGAPVVVAGNVALCAAHAQELELEVHLP